MKFFISPDGTLKATWRYTGASTVWVSPYDNDLNWISKWEWKTSHLPPGEYKQFHPATDFRNSSKEIVKALNKCRKEMERLGEQSLASRKARLTSHGQDFEPAEFRVKNVQRVLKQAASIEFERGKFRELSAVADKDWEQTIFALSEVSGDTGKRTVGLHVLHVWDRLVGDSEWGANDSAAPELPRPSLRFGDWMYLRDWPVTFDGNKVQYSWEDYTAPPDGMDESGHIISASKKEVFQSSSGARAPADPLLRQMFPPQSQADTSAPSLLDKGKGRQVLGPQSASSDVDAASRRTETASSSHAQM